MRRANVRVYLDNCCQVARVGRHKLRAKGQGTCTGHSCAVKGSVFELLQQTARAARGAALDVDAADVARQRSVDSGPEALGLLVPTSVAAMASTIRFLQFACCRPGFVSGNART